MTEARHSLLQNEPGAPYSSEVPLDVSIELTGRCNLRCRHCFNESGPESGNELPLARIEALLDEMQAWGARTVRLTGGEPTVHPRFREIVDACARRRIGIGLNTNGIFGAAMLDYLKTAPIDVFFVSIDGLEENNDAIRGSGTFRRAVATCAALKAAGRNVIVGFHVGEGNRADVPGLAAVAAELGVDFKVAPLRPVGRAARELPRQLIQPRNFYGVVRELTALRRVHPHIRIYTDFDLLEGSAEAECGYSPERQSCGAGRTLMNVRSDGAISPCSFFDSLGPDFEAGNIHDDSAREVWQRPTTFEAFRIQQKSGECRSCGFYQSRCRGGCPAIAYSTTGHLDALDPTCFADLIEPYDAGPAVEPIPPLPFCRFVTPPETEDPCTTS